MCSRAHSFENNESPVRAEPGDRARVSVPAVSFPDGGDVLFFLSLVNFSFSSAVFPHAHAAVDQ